MNELLAQHVLYAGTDDVVAFVDVYNNARQLVRPDEAFGEAVDAVRWLVTGQLAGLGAVDERGEWRPAPGTLDQQLDELTAGYRQDPSGEGEGQEAFGVFYG
ncbi:hypothetical protein NBRGN_062_00740 [Nocardia brasiliensis NBRC 14402]|uniref:hypothetical protein n=1 Tax=Nocardia brasiliensis TaxID=37326 RepID=UPI0002FF18C0|nr:hypothetical protein [Nocardia brasiliensis]ASF11067.1 hypothetical protein CEQ30_31190 [Nocardia brasiliensis]GAJ83236.1 hypothetical protein NBRGN_062_00740 [Nocardia brasiliensis NBRC 14402]SUB10263.1 Uncharacterised protein [Nocardia brasiliensis]